MKVGHGGPHQSVCAVPLVEPVDEFLHQTGDERCVRGRVGGDARIAGVTYRFCEKSEPDDLSIKPLT